MSKRYGRNQKRRHREEVARLMEANDMNVGLVRKFSSDAREANATIQEMVRVIESVAEHSVALPPKEMRGNSSLDRLSVSVAERLDFVKVVECANAPIPEVTFRSIDVYALRSFVMRRAEMLQTAVHLRYYNGRESAYMISEMALRQVPLDVLIRHIVPDISRELVRSLRDGGRE